MDKKTVMSSEYNMSYFPISVKYVEEIKNSGLFHLSFSRFHGVELGKELLLEGVAQRVVVPHKPMNESGKDPSHTFLS